MSYLGDFALGSTFDFKFTTRKFSTGAPFALASGTVVAYPDNSTTEVTGGITLSADFDGVTGLNNVRVVATSGNGYATATNYALVISAGTVDSVSVVGEVIGQFSIENRSALRPTTAGRTLDVTATGAAGIDLANVENQGSTLALSATTIKTATDVETDTADIQSRLPAALSSGRMDSSVGQMQSGVMTSTAYAAGAITASAIAADAIGASELAADAIAEIADAVWEEAIADHSGTVGSTAEQLAAAGAAGDPWATALPGAYGAGTAGKIVGDNVNATISSRATQTSVDTIDDFVDTEVAAILAAVDTEVAAIKTKTDSLTFTTANQVDCNVFAMQNNTVTTAAIAGNAIGTAEVNTAVDARIAGAVWDIVLASHLTAGSTGEALDNAQSGGGGGGSDPWETALPGAYAVGTAGQIVGNLDHSSRTLVRGTISSGSTTTSLNTSSITPTTIDPDQWVGRVLIFEKDTTTTGLRGQATEITSNTTGGVLTVIALTQAPVSGDTFSIV